MAQQSTSRSSFIANVHEALEAHLATDVSALKTIQTNQCFKHHSPTQSAKHQRYNSTVDPASTSAQLSTTEDDGGLYKLKFHEDIESKQSELASTSDTDSSSDTAETRSETAQSSNGVEHGKQELEIAKQEISQLKHQLTVKDRRIE